MFLEVLNGAYSAAGLEGRLKGVGLNKIVAGIHGKLESYVLRCSKTKTELIIILGN